MDTITEFLGAHGINEAELILDGTIKEIKTDKFKGWYIGDSLGVGKRSLTIESWTTRDRRSFTEGIDLSDPTEKAKLEESRLRFEEEKKAIQLSNRRMVEKHLDKFKAENWTGNSKYLLKKKIDSTFGATLIESPTIGTDIIIPMSDDHGVVWNYQTIGDEGFKSFVPGALVDGLFFQLTPVNTPENPAEIIICEGYATACSVKMAVSSVVVCAFMAENLIAVAETHRKKFPSSKIIIAGDDDWKKEPNAGRMKAEEAAAAVSGLAVFPVFAKVRGQTWSDWNDLHCGYSLETVRNQLQKALSEVEKPTKEFMEKFETIVTLKTQDTKTAAKALDAHVKAATNTAIITPYINGVQPLPVKIGKTGAPIQPSEFEVANALWKYYEGRAVISEESLFLFEGTHWKEVDKYMEGKIKLQIQVLCNAAATKGKLDNTYNQFLFLIPKAPVNLFNPNPYRVNFTNGTVHVEKTVEKWGMRFAAHHKEDYCVNLIPFEYDVTRKIVNKEFLEMLDRIFEKADDREDKIKAIRQMYGACVAPIFPHLFMLYGRGGSGKSSLIIPAQRLVHQDNLSAVEPHDFNGFKMAPMAGKLVNIVLDINTLEPIEDSHIKKIEDRMPVQIERKFKTSVLAPLPAVHIFGGNEIPATYEKGSGAHTRRWTFLGIEGFQAAGNYSKNFANEAFDACPVGVLNFALDGLQEVLNANGHYHVPVSGQEKMLAWQEANDPVALFVKEIETREIKSLKMNADGRVKRSEVWPIFVAWFRYSYSKAPRIPKSKFYEALPKVQNASEEVHLKIVDGVRYFSGLSATQEIDPWPADRGSIGSAP